MSNSSLVNYVKISPNKTVMTNKVNKKIVIHHMAGNLTVEQCGSVFAPTARKASANYGIGTDGRVGMYVEEKDRSWASSSSTIDSQAVTIEVANDQIGGNWHVSDKAYNKLIELCVDICKRNNIKELIWTGDKNGTLVCHYMFAATECPGTYLKSKMSEIAKKVTERLNPQVDYSPIYNFDYYIKNHKDLVGYKNNPSGAFEHFSLYGMKEGRQASNNFNVYSYAYKYADLRKAYKNDLKKYYEHYLNYGFKEKRIATGTSKMQNYTKIYNGVNYSAIYDYNYYVQNNPDIKKTFGLDDVATLEHFVKYGMKEGRQASNNFNVKKYKKRYADLQKAFGNDLPAYYIHYIKYGKSEGRTAK